MTKPTYEELEKRVRELERENTVLQKNEKQLQLFSSLVRQSEQGMAAADLAGHLIFVNEAFAAMHGYTSGELVGKHLSIFHTSEQMTSVEAANQIIKDTGEFKGEIWHVHKDGTTFPTLMHNSLIKNEEGQPIGFLGTALDITDMKRAEKALQESESRYSALFTGITDSVLVHHISEDGGPGQIIDANEVACQMLGYPKDELVGMGVGDIDAPESDVDVLRIVDALKSGRDVLFEQVHVAKDGKRIPVEVHTQTFEYKGRLAILSTVRDITERKRIEQELRKKDAMLANIASQVPGMLYQFMMKPDGSYSIPYSSNGVKDIFGCLPKDVLDDFTPIYNVIYPEDRDKIFRTIDESVKNLSQWKCEYRVQIPGKPIKWVYGNSIPEKMDDGSIIWSGYNMDITERKEAEKALRESEEKYRKLFNELPDVFYRTDIDGKLALASPSITEVLGYAVEEAVGMNVARDLYVDPSKRDLLLRALKDNGFVESFQAQLKHKDGSVVWASTNSRFYYDEQGNIAGVEGIFRDVTEHKRIEEEKKELQIRLQRAEKMEAVGTLAGGVAHDLNNVLSGLVSYPDLILMDLPEDSHLREPILTIQDSGKKAAAIVQDLLTLARRGVAISEIVNLNDVVNDYLKSPEHEKLKAYFPKAQIMTDLQEDLLNVLGSSIHLSKTLTNLVSNASESLHDEGVVVISTRNQYIDSPIQGYDEVQEGDYAILSVEDNGVGIEKGDLEKIFEPFYTKKVMGRSGTGLGMAVVWGTVKDHNGYINVQSKKGKGSKVTLYFPITRKEVDKGKSPSFDQYIGYGQNILVVDDVPQQREIASNLLNKLGYSVHSVSSGEEALEYIKENSVDLIILDMIMDPGMDGLDTYKKIIELNPGQKAIIASGFSETDRVKDAQKLGAGEYVKKPYTLEKIGLAVKYELNRQASSDEG